MNASIANIHAIILAAGASSRMGSPKQILKWRNRSLLEHAILNARSVLHERVIVVLGAHAEAIQTDIGLEGVTSVTNPDWQDGMASSIRTGIQALPATASAALILLCDQPLISATHLQNLLQRWQGAPERIVASEYNHTVGVPALFPFDFFAHLSALSGDRGAKFILLKFEGHLLKISLPEAELDIDDMKDFNRLSNDDHGHDETGKVKSVM